MLYISLFKMKPYFQLKISDVKMFSNSNLEKHKHINFIQSSVRQDMTNLKTDGSGSGQG
jgi:hypothetical protein